MPRHDRARKPRLSRPTRRKLAAVRDEGSPSQHPSVHPMTLRAAAGNVGTSRANVVAVGAPLFQGCSPSTSTHQLGAHTHHEGAP